MGKKFLTYSEQIEKLRTKKRIDIVDELYTIEILKRYSYYNFINGTKICFTSEKNSDGDHVYNGSDIYEWEECFEELLRLSNEIAGRILKIEMHLNSLVSYYISDKYLQNKSINIKGYYQIYYDMLNNIRNKRGRENVGMKEAFENSWKYVPELSFGDLIRLLEAIGRNDSGFISVINESLSLKISNLKTVREIRNELMHNTPILVCVNVPKYPERKKRRKVIRLILKDSVMLSTYEKYDEYVVKYNMN